MKQKILVITSGNIHSRRGLFNAVINRTKYLKQYSDYDIDILLLSSYESWFVRKLRHTKEYPRPRKVEIDGLSIEIDWRKFSLIDYVLSNKLHKTEIISQRLDARIAKSLNKYTLIIAHSHSCGLIAKRVKELYGTPFTVTWHGSDVHTLPLKNPTIKFSTKNVMECANMNIFVSEALMEASEDITRNCEKQVLYNGYNYIFKRYSDEERVSLRKKYNVIDKKVVVFAGNFLEVKNILTIPDIFKAIYKKYQNIEFWMIGDGKYRKKVEEKTHGLPIRLWGNQEPEVMPDYFNCSDVLILPSLNEGLGLTLVEGLICGCNVVGSLVGGIPEVIGEENCIDLNDPQFVENFAERVLHYLNAEKHISQTLNPIFDWTETAKKEIELINSIIREECR